MADSPATSAVPDASGPSIDLCPCHLPTHGEQLAADRIFFAALTSLHHHIMSTGHLMSASFACLGLLIELHEWRMATGSG